MGATLFQPVATPVWDGDTTEEVLTFGAAAFQSLTIPAAATAVVLSSLDTGGEQFWVSPVTTDPSGIRVGGTSSRPVTFRLGDSPTIRVKGNTGGGELFSAVYYYSQPPGGGCFEPVDVPLWDDQILNREYNNVAGATSEVFVPFGTSWFSLSVLETSAPFHSFVSTEDTDDTGIMIGGASGSPLIHRTSQKLITKGRPTSNDTGTTLTNNTGGNNFVTLGVQVGDTVYNRTDDSWGRVTVVAATALTHTQLVHGSGNNWDRLNDDYFVYRTGNVYVHNPDAVGAVDVGALFYKGA